MYIIEHTSGKFAGKGNFNIDILVDRKDATIFKNKELANTTCNLLNQVNNSYDYKVKTN